MHREPAAVAFLGGPRAGREQVYAEASPVTHVSADDPPVLLTHGTEDRTVPYSQAEVLKARLEQVGVPVELITVRGGGHGFQGGEPDDIREANARTKAFMLEHLLGGAAE